MVMYSFIRGYLVAGMQKVFFRSEFFILMV